MPDCFAYDQKDALFYDQNIRDRLPKKLVDAHCHVNLPSHVGPLDPADIAGDWALQCGVELPAERAKSILRTLFPDARTNCLALPLPLEQANMAANNSYLAELFTRLGEPALMAVKPSGHLNKLSMICWLVDSMDSSRTFRLRDRLPQHS